MLFHNRCSRLVEPGHDTFSKSSLREGSPWAHTSGQERISERNDPAGRSQARQRQAALPLERVVSKREPARTLVIKGFSFIP